MFYFYQSKSFNPFENLAIEEYLLDFANNSKDVFILYLWQNDNTLVLGRNQDAFSECNLKNLDKYSTTLVRRKTGGGAVFHDINNLNFSFIVPKKLFDKQKSMSIIQSAISQLGTNVEISGRNDLLISGKKFSGSAYLNKQNATLHHGTILIDTNLEILNSVLNVNKAKLNKNSVKSVKNRVINIKEIIKNINLDDLILSIKDTFLKTYDGNFCQIELNFEDVRKIKKFYEDDNWIFGDKKFLNAQSYYKNFKFGLGQLKIFYDKQNKYLKFYSDSLDVDLISDIQTKINKFDFKSTEDIFNFIDKVTGF